MHPLPAELPKWLHAIDSGKDTMKNMVYCRILGYLFHFFPTDLDMKTVVYEVVSAVDEEAFF